MPGAIPEDTRTTSIDTDPATHTPEQNARIEEYRNSTDGRILSFIKRLSGMKDVQRRNRQYQKLDPVSSRAVSDLLAITGIDTTGYTHQLTGSAVSHIERRHGKNGVADHSMQDANDVARITYVLENYDSVERSDGVKGSTFSYNNSDNTLAQTVLFTKKVDGNYYVVEAVPDSNAKVLGIVSAYMSNAKGSNAQVVNMPAEPTHTVTPEATHGNNASSDATVSQPASAVNPVYQSLRELVGIYTEEV